MDHQFFFSIFFLFILTINYSLTLSYFDRTNDISKDNLDQSDEDISDKYDDNQDHSKRRRQVELTSRRTNMINKNKTKSRLLTYDFLLHQWTLRKMGKN